LDSLMLRKNQAKIDNLPFLSGEEGGEKDLKMFGNEVFGLMSTLKDLSLEYSEVDELDKARDAYIIHISDIVLKERALIEMNDKQLKEERLAGKVTLDKVFDLAKGEEESEEEVEEDDDEEGELEQEETKTDP